jgi:hypothetical protein
MNTTVVSFIQGDLFLEADLNDSLLGDDCHFDNLTAETQYCMRKVFGEDNTILDEGDLAVLKYKLTEGNSLVPETPFTLNIQPKVET